MSAGKTVHQPGRPEQRISVGITAGRLYTPTLCGELNIRAKRAASPANVTCSACLSLMTPGAHR